MGKFDRKTFEHFTDQIAKAAVDSLQHQIPVTAEWGITDAGELLGSRMEENPKLSIPLKAIRFKKSDEAMVAQMVFFAAHPTIFSADNLYFSADFPGELTKLLENENPNSTALFINGAAGDLKPSGPYSESKEKRIHLYGKALKDKINEINFKPLDLDGKWEVLSDEVMLPPVKIRLGRFTIPSVIGNCIFDRKVLFQTLQLNESVFMMLPAEVSSSLGRQMEDVAKNHGYIPFFVGYANDYAGYVISRNYYRDRHQYEARASFYGENLDFFVLDKIIHMIGSLKNEPPGDSFSK